MAIEVHVQGEIVYGRLREFCQAADAYLSYARANGYTTPQMLQGISGPMNTILFIYRYADLSEYERHEARTATDAEYGRVASAMPYRDGSINYQIYRDLDESDQR